MNARRGDLVVVEYGSDGFAGSGASFELEKVTKVTRDGDISETQRVMRWRPESELDVHEEPLFRNSTSRGNKIRRYRCYYERCYVISADQVDCLNAWRDCTERTDAEYAWCPGRFSTLDAARAWISPYRTDITDAMRRTLANA